MLSQLTIRNILAMAIDKEIESQRLYRDLSQKMMDAATKDVFLHLYQEEQGHENLLRKYLRGELTEGALRQEQALDYKIAEHLDQPEISLDMKLKDVFLLAANREKSSHEFYLSLAAVHPLGRTKSLLEELASQELEHKQKVEFLYTEVAFPQTDGG